MKEKEFINLIGSDDVVEMLAKYSYAIIRNRDLAQDIAQDTLVKALSSCQNFDGKNINGWLKTICKRTYLDWIKKKKEKLKDSSDDPDIDDVDKLNPENLAEYRIILDIIDDLEPPKPEIVKKTFLGETQEEIAKSLNIRRPRVSELLSEARDQLSEILGVKWQPV
tara:strand:- start:5890 stop:6387 length:498 start_codon:yes stop_codon:yes gene_type:complete